MATKIDEKSMKNRGWIGDAFLDRFGMALGCQMVDFGSQNLQNIIKMATKIVPKSMKNRGCVAAAFLERQKLTTYTVCRTIAATIFDQKSKKWHPKMHAKTDAEKVSKIDAKRVQNEVKIDAEIIDFHTFSKRAKMLETISFTITI